MKKCRFVYLDTIRTGTLESDYSKVVCDDTREVIDSAAVSFLPPVEPSKIVCVGRNYADHAKELGNAVPSAPLLFLKAPSSLITTDDAILIPEQSDQVEHEGELAVIIGRKCKNISMADQPLSYAAGFTCLNDVTARDVQKNDVQFTRGKSFDTFCPVLHYFETEVDPLDLAVVTRVNGVVKQEGRTSQMVFPVDFLISYISHQMTLNPGDIIATGTPSGVSKLSAGDICEVEITGIGTLKNPVNRA